MARVQEDSVPWARAAQKHLRRSDPVMAEIIRQVGPLKMIRRPERFQALARAIIFQQLAGAAAMAIYNRFVALFGDRRFPTPLQVLEKPDRELRSVGLSAAKTLYIKDLANHIANKTLNFHRFPKMSDDEVVEELTQVKGIGRWTAEMFLMFNLSRPDVLAVDDLGFRNAARKAYRLRKHPDAKRLKALAERWRPYRSAAVWYLWRNLSIRTPDAATPPKPKTSRAKPPAP